jgi:DNA modification methylase
MANVRNAKLSELTPDPGNANKGTERGAYMVRQSLQKLGAGRSVLIDKNGVLIAGNKTTEAAYEIGLEDVIVVPTDGTKLVVVQRTDLDLAKDAKAKELAIADNRASELGLEWDAEVLQEVHDAIGLEDWFTEDEVAAWSMEGGEWEQPSEEEDEEATADLIDEAEGGEMDCRFQVGDIIALGRHRIACGDSTNEDNVRSLLDGKTIDLIFTDPPYGVSYADKNKSLNATGRGNRIQTPIENDHLAPEEISDKIWKPVFQLLCKFAKPGASYYVCGPQGGELLLLLMTAIADAGLQLKHGLVWVKNNHVLGRCDYHYKHEPILYGWKPGATHYFIDSRSEFSVWNFDKPLKSDLHPTMKPIELIQYAIKNSSRPNELVADFFLGSGSTLIAAQGMEGDRTVYGFELSPHYIEVICRRYEKFTGETAKLVGHL